MSDGGDDALTAALRDPAVRAALARLLAKLDRIDTIVDTAGRFSEQVPVVADAAGTTATWAWKQAEDAGVDPLAAGKRGAALLLALGRPEVLATIERLLTRRVLLERALDTLDALGPDLAPLLGAGEEPGTAVTTLRGPLPAVESAGPWAAFRKLGDPDVKRAVGFLLGVAKGLGRLLNRSST